jgi:hypothetical protein
MALGYESVTERMIGAAVSVHRLGPGVFRVGLREGPHRRQDDARTQAPHRSLTYFLRSWFLHCI